MITHEPVLTYIDALAGSVIPGNLYVASNSYQAIATNPDEIKPSRLKDIVVIDDRYFFKMADGELYQFVREYKSTEPIYTAYNNTYEMIEDFNKRFKTKEIPNHAKPLIWLQDIYTGYEHLIEGFGGDCVIIDGKSRNLQYLFDRYTYLDYSPCGKREEAQT